VGGGLHQFVVASPHAAQCDDDRRRDPAAARDACSLRSP
jgi:hypothetical protein